MDVAPRAVALIGLIAALNVGPAWSADPTTLAERAAAIERASTQPDGTRVVIGHLSRKLGVPVDTLRRQRTQTDLNWGELLIANRLVKETRLGLDQIVAEFRGGKSWEEIARARGADLDKLREDVKLSQDAVEQRSEDRGMTPTAKSPDGSSSTSAGSTGQGAASPGSSSSGGPGASGRRRY